MGCEFCSNENRKDIEFRLNGEVKRPIELKGNVEDYSLTKDTYYSSLEEKLNEKYSISAKILEEYKEKKNCVKDNEINRQYINNKIIDKNKNQKKDERESDELDDEEKLKNERKIDELKNNLKSKEKKSRNKNNEEINDINSLNNKESNNVENREKYNETHSHSHKHSHKKKNRNKHRNKRERKEKDKEKMNQNSEEEERKSKNNKENYEENNEEHLRNDNDNSENEEEDIRENDKNNNNYICDTEKIKMLLKDINYSKIDKILNDAPKRSKTTLEKLISYFKKNSKKLSLVERAWLVYKWITENIEYDFSGVNSKSYDISEIATFNRGKSICSGYSGLYKKICENLDLVTERIGGYSKGFNFTLNENIEDSEKHEWNAVQIDKSWFLVETTWGAGYSTDDKHFIKKFNPYFFFTSPYEFIRGHLPFDSKWQLLPSDKAIDEKKFMSFAPLKSNFFTLGFKFIEPDNTFNYVKEKGSFKLYFKDDEEIEKSKIKVMAKLYKKNNKEIKNSVLEVKKEKYLEINYLLNEKGEYTLKIFGNNNINTKEKEYHEYEELCTLKLITEKDITNPKTYPNTTGLYYNSDIEIIRPNNGTLKEGNRVTFELKTTTYDILYIGVKTDSGSNFFPMNKYGNNVFKEEDLLIYGKNIIISCKGEKENSYNTILEYNVSLIKKNKSTINYPQVFAGPKNRLIEPICDKLKKGKKINFSIKCELIEEMGVVDGEDFHDLEKKNDIFSGEIKILGKGDVKIVFKKKDGDGYGVLYLYKVI